MKIPRSFQSPMLNKFEASSAFTTSKLFRCLHSGMKRLNAEFFLQMPIGSRIHPHGTSQTTSPSSERCFITLERIFRCKLQTYGGLPTTTSNFISIFNFCSSSRCSKIPSLLVQIKVNKIKRHKGKINGNRSLSRCTTKAHQRLDHQ